MNCTGDPGHPSWGNQCQCVRNCDEELEASTDTPEHETSCPFVTTATTGTTCSTPTSIEHANIRVKSYNENSRERYICNSGFKRKAGTSSLTKCLRNEDTNVTEWTIPSLKCVRDRSLTPQRPPSTVAPARVTPEPDSPSPSGKEPAFSSKSDVAVATKQAVVPGAGLMPSEPPSAGGPGTVKREPSQATPQTTAEVVGRTPTSSLDKPGQQPPPLLSAAAAGLWSLTSMLCPGAVQPEKKVRLPDVTRLGVLTRFAENLSHVCLLSVQRTEDGLRHLES
ncbi:Interleukin-15 receptor subunit alpha [Pteropus alecto]|uniref:Interleukin-15 receptor subunit alpha n=1 Tax=Pteropus alecto TaxID=9402 RepID=L5KZW3_PTEAL|nr:Interleukin-15 receptor subunit alpha [Pteropus alecto]